jgi:hypothetical protein
MIEKWKTRLGGISDNTLRESRTKIVCLKCEQKNYTQWYCPQSWPKVMVTSALSTQLVRPQKQKYIKSNIKEESLPPNKK